MIIKYDPNTTENIPIFLNAEIEKNKNEDYIMFIFNDIAEQIKDENEFFDKYVKLMKKFDLPFAFYPYYIHFNKVLASTFSVPMSKMHFEINREPVCDVVNQTTYGMMIIDVKKVLGINFKFNEKYAKCFYIQELIEECFKNNLYFSSSWFLDVPKSYEMVNSNFKDGFKIDTEMFKAEKDEFTKIYNLGGETVNDYIKKLSEKCKEIKENTAIVIEGIKAE